MNTRRRHRHGLLRRGAAGVAVAYIVALTLIAFWPTPVDRGVHGSLSSIVDWLHSHGVPVWLDYASIEFSANIVLFLPVGLLVVVLVGTGRWWLGPAAGMTLSCAIELGQLLFLPERFATLSDVLANTLGAIGGTIIAVVVLRLALGPRLVPHPA